MKIDDDLLERIQSLARLKLTDEEQEKLKNQLSQILDHVETINELDLEDVEPLTHPLDLNNVHRPDRADESLNVESVLKNAPERSDSFFHVPRVIEE